MTARGVERRALVAAPLVAFLWGSNFTAQKLVLGAFGPGGFLFGRALVMAVCALLLLWLRFGRIWPRLAPGEWREMWLVVAVGPIGHLVFVAYGIHWSTAFSSALIMSCGPVFTLILLALMRGSSLGRSQLLGVAMAFGGVLLFMSDKLRLEDMRAGYGDLLMLGGALGFSLYTLWVTPLAARHGGLQVMCWTTLLSSPLMMLVTAATAWQVPLADTGGVVWLAFFWSVLISAFVGWVLWSWINAVLGVARTAPVMYLVPLVAGVVAWAMLGETFGTRKIAGALLALAGVGWTQFAPRRGPAAPR